MADSTISGLDPVVTPATSDIFPCVQAAEVGIKARKQTIQQVLNAHIAPNYLPLSGGTMTGLLKLSGDGGTDNLNPITYQQFVALSVALTDAINTKFNTSGGTFGGAITLYGDATAPLNPVTLQQFLAALTALSLKEPCYAATTVNLNATYNNGVNGVGATLTANTNGAFFADGLPVQAPFRILVKSQTNPIQNGIYNVTMSGNASNPYVLTRSPDYDGSIDGQIYYGSLINVLNGNTCASTQYYMFNFNGSPVPGNFPIEFVQTNYQTGVAPLSNPTPNSIALDQSALTLSMEQISGLVAALASKADKGVEVLQVTGTTYTVQASDNGKRLVFTGACVVTVLPYGVGFNFSFTQDAVGDGQIEFVAGSGLDGLLSADNAFKTRTQYSVGYYLEEDNRRGKVSGDLTQ
jgi:hypothetical protein